MSTETDKSKLEICHFRVPIIIKEEEGKKVAEFKEVEMKDLCFKKELIEPKSSQEAMILAREVADSNTRTLAVAAKIKKDGDISVRKVVCAFNKVQVNTEI